MLYTHIAQIMTHTTYVYTAYNYVTKLFGILQRVIMIQKVYIYHLDSAKTAIFSLRKVSAAKIPEIFKFLNFQSYEKV